MIKNGYVAGAVLLIPFSKKLRDHVETEKFLCRIVVDNDQTKQFKQNTADLKDQLFALRYNNEAANKLTAEGKAKNGD